jgi:CheY-like chemotaxis protein
MALRSGARLRRANSIQSAKRHLRVYMPSVIIVDVGLPDGSGLDLIRELSNTRPRVAALIGTSGDELHHTATLKAGADVFISKPYESLASFQQTLLNLFPGSEPLGLRLVSNDMVHPDPAALRDDLYHAKSLIEHDTNKPMCDYLRQFLTGVAKSVGDTHLERAAQNEPIEDWESFIMTTGCSIIVMFPDVRWQIIAVEMNPIINSAYRLGHKNT